MKILIIIGTRPEAIKLAPVVRALIADKHFEVQVCVTAQHREMLDQVLSLFEIVPDVDLNLMTQNQTLAGLTGRILQAISAVLDRVKPDMIMVQGDTTTVFAASLAAYYQNIKIAHVEAGLRTFDKRSPFPEEINRVMTSHLADIHFAPTEISKANLLHEHIADESVFVTGNTVIDALLWVRDRNMKISHWQDYFGSLWPVLESQSPIILITGHRRENFGKGFEAICDAVARLAKCHPEWELIYPVHLNPNVQKPVKEKLNAFKNIHLIAPQEYEPFVYLMDKAKLILTDSGGVQEEAPSLGKPVLVMRDKTERPEGVEAGTVMLVGANSDNIVDAVAELMGDPEAYAAMSNIANPYGDGQASQRIVNALIAYRDKNDEK